MAGTESTNYITHKQIDKITPVYEDGKQAGLCITLRNGQLYWTSESFSTDQHGITGKFTGKINSKSIGTGFPPGSPNDDAARLAAHG